MTHMDFEQYLANIQADTSIAREEGSFAHYTARDSAIMWMRIFINTLFKLKAMKMPHG